MQPNMIGAYGPWAASLVGEEPGEYSFRNPEWTDLDAWREAARARLNERLASPNTGSVTEITVHRQHNFDGLHVEELT